MSSKINEVLSSRKNQLSNDNIQLKVNKFTSIDNSKLITEEELESILNSIKHLTHPDYHRGWYVKRLFQMGRPAFLEAAQRAEKYGKPPAKLFTYLIKDTRSAHA